MSSPSSRTALERHERKALAEAMGASLKPHERALAVLFLVTMAVLLRASWHVAFG
jgi:hypothetical protein